MLKLLRSPRSLATIGLAVLLLASGCSGPQRPLEVGIKELPSDVLLASGKNAADGQLPPGIDIDSAIAPGGIDYIGDGTGTRAAGPFVPSTIRTSRQRGATCPDAPAGASALPAPASITEPARAVSHVYRNDGTFTLAAGQGAYPTSSYRTVTQVDSRPEPGDAKGFHFTVADDLMLGSRNITKYYANEIGLFIVEVLATSPRGTETLFKPDDPRTVPILMLPARAGDTRSVVASESGTAKTLQYTLTTIGKVRLDACGVPIEAWEVRLDGRYRDAAKNTDVTFVQIYNIATQMGGLIVADAIEAGCTSGPGVDTPTCANTINGIGVHIKKRGVTDLTVGDVPSVIVAASDAKTIGTATRALASFDGGQGPYTCKVDYGDGSTPVRGTVQEHSCVGPPHTYNRGRYIVTVLVTGADGATGGGSTFLDLSAAPLPKPPPPPPRGLRFFDDPLGDSIADYFDLYRGEVTCAPGTITFRVTLSELNSMAPPDNGATHAYNVFRVSFDYAGKRRFVDLAWATKGGTVAPFWGDGDYNSDGTPVLQHPIEGRFFEGSWGAGEADLPLAHIEATGPNVTLTNVRTESWYYDWYAFYVGTPTPNPGGVVRDSAPVVNLTSNAGQCSVG